MSLTFLFFFLFTHFFNILLRFRLVLTSFHHDLFLRIFTSNFDSLRYRLEICANFFSYSAKDLDTSFPALHFCPKNKIQLQAGSVRKDS
ncbi:unnamed protein product [Amoebophrya sp. A120]|nr:unnamed protein product [Amoebophrya sp. A120]|eukprot:GSA120T00013417001.1